MVVWLAIEARRLRWNKKSKRILFLKSRRWLTLLQTFVKYNMIIIYNPPVSHFSNNSKIVREMLFRFSENKLYISFCFIWRVRLCCFVPELPLSIGFFNREVYKYGKHQGRLFIACNYMNGAGRSLYSFSTILSLWNHNNWASLSSPSV